MDGSGNGAPHNDDFPFLVPDLSIEGALSQSCFRFVTAVPACPTALARWAQGNSAHGSSHSPAQTFLCCEFSTTYAGLNLCHWLQKRGQISANPPLGKLNPYPQQKRVAHGVKARTRAKRMGRVTRRIGF